MTIIGIDGFRAAATTLGLRLEAPDVPWWRNNSVAMLEGLVDGTRVLVQQGNIAPWMRVYFHAALEPALDLGLGVSLRGSYVGQKVGLSQPPLDNASFEQAFDIKAREPWRLAAFLTPAMREALIGWHKARLWERDAATKNSLELWVTDESVIVRIQTNALGFGVSSQALVTEELIRDIRATAALARQVNEVAKVVPPASVLAPQAAAWQAFASTHGLAFFGSPLRMSGVFAGHTFAARAAFLDNGDYGVELTMPFARPLPFYLRLGEKSGLFEAPRSYPDAWAEWASRHKTGDATFDAELRVVSVDPDAQNALLSPELRKALLDLQRMNEHVHMTTESVSVRTKRMVAPEAFAEMLRPLSEIETMVDRAMAR